MLATLVTGLMLGQGTVSSLEPTGRLRVAGFWDVLVFLLESVLFVLVGLQLRHLLSAMHGYRASSVALVAGLAVVVTMVVRVAWWAALPDLRWRPEGRVVDTGAVPWQQRLVLGWSGLRGAMSLAAALSVPTVVSGHAFAGRNLIVFTTFCVILATLVGQGTSLPWLLRALKMAGGGLALGQHALANRRCAEAALRRLDELVANEKVPDEVAETFRRLYEGRIERARAQLGDGDEEKQGGDSFSEASWAALQRRLLRAQDQVLQRMYREGEISYSVLRGVRRELDLEQASLGR